MMKSIDGDDRRQSDRRYRHGHAELVSINGAGTDASVQVMNVSEGGIRLVSNAEIRQGERFVIRIDGVERNCEVRECKALYNGFTIRSEFFGG